MRSSRKIRTVNYIIALLIFLGLVILGVLFVILK